MPTSGTPWNSASAMPPNPPCMINSRTFGWARMSSCGSQSFSITLAGLFGMSCVSHFQMMRCFSVRKVCRIALSISGGMEELNRLVPRLKKITPSSAPSIHWRTSSGRGEGLSLICNPPTSIIAGTYGRGVPLVKW
uniref:Uncharacterized protein n=1 Tax=Anopheles melas TaxID=34690 RepID=A0A182UJH9_9DIPT